jgi:hypothetical protein
MDGDAHTSVNSKTLIYQEQTSENDTRRWQLQTMRLTDGPTRNKATKIDTNISNPSTSSQTNTIDTSPDTHSATIYTFIIHETNFSHTKRAPTFASFDHGAHVHYIFTISHTNNCNRAINKILQFLKAFFF